LRRVPRPSSFLLGLVLVPLFAGLAARHAPDEPVPLAGSAPAGVLAFEVRDGAGALVPARLTFVLPDGTLPELFTNVKAAGRDFAARKDVVYTRTGAGAITVPVGRYTVYASRGLEWSLASAELEFRAGERVSWRAELVHEVDTTGWVSGDFHLHTLTHSGHGDADLEERVLSFLGEGLEFAVATDHNHNTDYAPTVRALGVESQLTTVTGNEVTTDLGHCNAFPLDPARAPVAVLTDAAAQFRLIRAETNAAGAVPVIQLNHPRWEGMDWFRCTGLDPATGLADARFSADFDAIELLNENVGWGYFDPVADARDTGGNRHSVLQDWFLLLQRGARYAAVGNSDSHHVQKIFAGWPRNFVRSATDDPGRIDVGAVAGAVRAKQVFTTLGPFVDYSVEGVPMGGDARARDGHATLKLRVQAASWIDCDRVQVIVNGELARSLPVPEAKTPLRLETELELCLQAGCARHGAAGPRGTGGPRDAWVTLLVEGDRHLFPILNDEAQPALPLCVANPVWIDGDGDGRWTSPAQRIEAELAAQGTPDLARRWFEGLGPAEQVLALAALRRGPVAAVLLGQALTSPARAVRLAAARMGERCTLEGISGPFERAFGQAKGDPFLGALCLRALHATRREVAVPSLLAFLKSFGEPALRDYADELAPLFEGARVPPWRVALDTPAVADDAPGPEQALAWRELAPDARGYLDLTALAPDARSAGTAAWAEAFLHCDAARKTVLCLGSDDGCRVWLGERLVYENPAERAANPLEKVLELELAPGWNRLVVRVDNAGGDFGLYGRVLDADVRLAPRPE